MRDVNTCKRLILKLIGEDILRIWGLDSTGSVGSIVTILCTGRAAINFTGRPGTPMFGNWESFAIDRYFPKCGPRILRDPPPVSRESVDTLL